LIELNTIYNENCISENLNEGMNRIPDKSIDMILCDLPYGTTQNKWDSIIPLDRLWKQYRRIIKDNGAIVLTSSQPFTTKLVGSNLKMWKDILVWDKISTTGFLNAKRRPLRRHEDILIFYKKQPTYNPQMEIRGKPRNKGLYDKRKGDGDSCYGKFENVKSFNNEYYPTSIVQFSNANQKDKIHTTQKPVPLFEYLIKTYTNKGETVLDNCTGSGTTAIACINTERKYLVFEQNKEIYKTAKKRIEAHTKQRRLF